jgi:hypothetical protein
VCTDIKVDYHSQGYAAYIRNADGSGEPAPAEVSLSLTFKETEVISKQFLNPSPVAPAAVREPDIRTDMDPPAVAAREGANAARTFRETVERNAERDNLMRSTPPR